MGPYRTQNLASNLYKLIVHAGRFVFFWVDLSTMSMNTIETARYCTAMWLLGLSNLMRWSRPSQS